MSIPTAHQVEAAVAAAYAIRYAAAALPAHTRADALAHVSARLAERADEVSRVIAGETIKPLKRARGEVPYGGIKASGVGREGIRAAMEDDTDVRVLVFSGVDL